MRRNLLIFALLVFAAGAGCLLFINYSDAGGEEGAESRTRDSLELNTAPETASRASGEPRVSDAANDRQPSVPDIYIRGRILDANRAPISAATVSLSYHNSRNPDAPSFIQKPGGLDGAFAIPMPTGRDRQIFLLFQKRGFADYLLRLYKNGTGDLDIGIITLTKSAAVKGVVRRADGAPAAGAKIIYDRLVDGSGEACGLFINERTALADFAGEFNFTELPIGTIEFVATHPEFGDGTKTITISSPATSASNVNISLAERLFFTIRVHDSDGDAPLPGATIQLEDGEKYAEVITGKNGEARVAIPTSDTNTPFTVWREGYFPIQRTTSELKFNTKFELKRAPFIELEFDQPVSPSFKLWTLDLSDLVGESRAAAGVDVSTDELFSRGVSPTEKYYYSVLSPNRVRRSIITYPLNEKDEEIVLMHGRFVFAAIDVNNKYFISAPVEIGAGSTSSVLLKRESNGRIHGIVKMHDGRSPENLMISCAPSVYDDDLTELFHRASMDQYTKCDRNGSFIFDELPPGKYSIRISDNNILASVQTVRLTKSAPMADVTIHAERPAAIAGTLTINGSPPREQYYVLIGELLPDRFTEWVADSEFAVCDANGNFNKTGLPPGKYKFTPSRAGSSPADALTFSSASVITNLTAGPNPPIQIRAVTTEPAKLKVIVHANNRPARELSVDIQQIGTPEAGDSSRGFSLETDDNGIIIFNIPYGRYSVAPRLNIPRPAREIYLIPGENASIEFDMSVGSVRGRFVNSKHSPVSAVYKAVPCETDGTYLHGAVSWLNHPAGMTGEFNIPYLAPGKWKIIAQGNTGNSKLVVQSAEINIIANETLSLGDLELSPLWEFSIQSQNASGEPILANISVTRAGGVAWDAVEDNVKNVVSLSGEAPAGAELRIRATLPDESETVERTVTLPVDWNPRNGPYTLLINFSK